MVGLTQCSAPNQHTLNRERYVQETVLIFFSLCSLSPYISLFCSFSCGFIIIESMQRVRSWSALWSSVESKQDGLVIILGAGFTSES